MANTKNPDKTYENIPADKGTDQPTGGPADQGAQSEDEKRGSEHYKNPEQPMEVGDVKKPAKGKKEY